MNLQWKFTNPKKRDTSFRFFGIFHDRMALTFLVDFTIAGIVSYYDFFLYLLEFSELSLDEIVYYCLYSSSKQSPKDCSSDFTGMFIFNI
jgi:hypothetical protein